MAKTSTAHNHETVQKAVFQFPGITIEELETLIAGDLQGRDGGKIVDHKVGQSIGTALSNLKREEVIREKGGRFYPFDYQFDNFFGQGISAQALAMMGYSIGASYDGFNKTQKSRYRSFLAQLALAENGDWMTTSEVADAIADFIPEKFDNLGGSIGIAFQRNEDLVEFDESQGERRYRLRQNKQADEGIVHQTQHSPLPSGRSCFRYIGDYELPSNAKGKKSGSVARIISPTPQVDNILILHMYREGNVHSLRDLNGHRAEKQIVLPGIIYDIVEYPPEVKVELDMSDMLVPAYICTILVVDKSGKAYVYDVNPNVSVVLQAHQ